MTACCEVVRVTVKSTHPTAPQVNDFTSSYWLATTARSILSPLSPKGFEQAPTTRASKLFCEYPYVEILD